MAKLKAVASRPEDSFSGRARDSVTGWWGRSRRFLSEVRNEMGRVTWPSQKEVYATTFVVILFSVVMGVYLWVRGPAARRGHSLGLRHLGRRMSDAGNAQSAR